VGRLDGDRVVELDAPDVGALLSAGPAALEPARHASGPVHDAATVDLAPVVPRPGKVICLGLNYESHIRETGRDLPEHPTLFAKFADSLTGPRDPIVLPQVSEKVDWEAELAFVVGAEARHVDGAEAEAAIAGFTVLNDVSMRDWQYRTLQWLQGKAFERSTPLGPALVSPDEVDGARDLEIRCVVDGEVMQRSRTSDLVFSPADIVAYISRFITLRPGDVIATGTPGGVGAFRTPPVFLQPGQELRTIIEGVGELVNEVIKEEGETP
jgi:acylpyruvate hydrolase